MRVTDGKSRSDAIALTPDENAAQREIAQYEGQEKELLKTLGSLTIRDPAMKRDLVYTLDYLEGCKQDAEEYLASLAAFRNVCEREYIRYVNGKSRHSKALETTVKAKYFSIDNNGYAVRGELFSTMLEKMLDGVSDPTKVNLLHDRRIFMDVLYHTSFVNLAIEELSDSRNLEAEIDELRASIKSFKEAVSQREHRIGEMRSELNKINDLNDALQEKFEKQEAIHQSETTSLRKSVHDLQFDLSEKSTLIEKYESQQRKWGRIAEKSLKQWGTIEEAISNGKEWRVPEFGVLIAQAVRQREALHDADSGGISVRGLEFLRTIILEILEFDDRDYRPSTNKTINAIILECNLYLSDGHPSSNQISKIIGDTSRHESDIHTSFDEIVLAFDPYSSDWWWLRYINLDSGSSIVPKETQDLLIAATINPKDHSSHIDFYNKVCGPGGHSELFLNIWNQYQFLLDKNDNISLI